MYKIKLFITLIIVHLTLIIGGKTAAQDFGIYDLSAKTNLDSTDMLMLSQAVDSAYYKLLWDRVVDSVEDSIRGNIVNAWIKSGAAIAIDKLATGTTAYIIVNNGSGVPTYVAMSGDATISNAGAVTIAGNAIGTAEITDGSIVNADINAGAAIVYSKLDLNNSIDSSDIVDGQVTSNDILNSTIVSLDILDGTIASVDIANLTIVNDDISSSAAIDLNKLESGTAAQIILFDDTGEPDWVSVTGDITIDEYGAVDIANDLSDNFVYTGSSSYTTEAFTPSGSTTLSAASVKIMLCQLDANSATITDFTSGTDGQEITVINSNTSGFSLVIDHGAEIVTNTQADKTIAPGETIQFIYVAATDLWYELGQ